MKLLCSKLALCIAFLAPACASVDEQAPESLGDSTLELTTLNGVALNGVALNGVALNGVALNGVALNGVALNGSALSGFSADGQSYFGEGFIGAVFAGLLPSGGTTPLFIDGARRAGDVWLYRASFTNAAGVRQPLCGIDAAGAAVEAIGLKGRWDYREGVAGGGAHLDDPSAFTFACRNAALGKCVDLGYRPWVSANGVSLANHHQACSRMVRADYCGDGTSYTVDGTPLNLYDKVGIQADAEEWPFEAEWAPAGARFVSKANHTRFKLSKKGKAPPCFKERESKEAGDLAHFSTGTLLMTEFDKHIAH